MPFPLSADLPPHTNAPASSVYGLFSIILHSPLQGAPLTVDNPGVVTGSAMGGKSINFVFKLTGTSFTFTVPVRVSH